MQLTKKRILLTLAAAFLALLALLPGVARADNDPDAEPVVSTIADRLIVQLGPEWAGTEFSLTTDMGVYPGVITVNDAGILTTELGGSSTYTLVCLHAPGRQEGAEPAVSGEQPATQPHEQQEETEPLPPAAGAPEPAAVPEQSLQQAAPVDQLVPEPEREAQSGIPTMHLVLFIGGAVLCTGGLIVMAVLRHRRNDYYDEEDDE